MFWFSDPIHPFWNYFRIIISRRYGIDGMTSLYVRGPSTSEAFFMFLDRSMLVPIMRTIWPRKVGTHHFGAHNAIGPVTSVPVTNIYCMSRNIMHSFSACIGSYEYLAAKPPSRHTIIYGPTCPCTRHEINCCLLGGLQIASSRLACHTNANACDFYYYYYYHHFIIILFYYLTPYES